MGAFETIKYGLIIVGILLFIGAPVLMLTTEWNLLALFMIALCGVAMFALGVSMKYEINPEFDKID